MMMQPRHKSVVNISHFRGTARKVELRTELGNVTKTRRGDPWRDHQEVSRSYVNNSQVLTFRVEVTEKEGNIIGYKQVMLEGEKITGIICDGDTVEVIGEEGISGIDKPSRILNLTTGTEITANRSLDKSESYGPVLLVIFGLLLMVLVTATLAPPISTLVCSIVFTLFFLPTLSAKK